MDNTNMSHVFKHPKYYEELRKLRKEEEATSGKPQADKVSSRKRQASSPEQQAASDKPQAASS